LYLGGWGEAAVVNGASQAKPPRSLAPPLAGFLVVLEDPSLIFLYNNMIVVSALNSEDQQLCVAGQCGISISPLFVLSWIFSNIVLL
jgi:hypothetical protein